MPGALIGKKITLTVNHQSKWPRGNRLQKTNSRPGGVIVAPHRGVRLIKYIKLLSELGDNVEKRPGWRLV